MKLKFIKLSCRNFHNLYLNPEKYGREIAETAVETKVGDNVQLDKTHINIVNKHLADKNAPKASLQSALVGYKNYLQELGDKITPAQQTALDKVNNYLLKKDINETHGGTNGR